MSAQLNQLVRRLFLVTDVFGDAVTGLSTGSFTLLLQRRTANTLTTASESVTVLQIGSGQYWADFTPTVDIGLYVLTITHASHIVSPAQFQIEVEAGFAAASGPYLTTRLNVRQALDMKDTNGAYTGSIDDDLRIDMLLASVTDWAKTFCDREFFAATDVTELTQADGGASFCLVLSRFPAAFITSVHVSEDLPRVYGADQLLVKDTDYITDLERGIIERVGGGVWPVAPQTVQIVYNTGYATIPADLEFAAIECIGFSLMRASGKLLHLTSESHQEGSLAGVRFDMPDTAMRVFRMYQQRA